MTSDAPGMAGGSRLPKPCLARVRTTEGAVRPRRAGRAAILVAVAVGQLVACRSRAPDGPSTSVATHPDATNRLARLFRQQLSDSNPVAVGRLIACEATRLAEALTRDLGESAGTDEYLRRTEGVRDSIYRTPADRARIEMIRNRLGGRTYESVGPFCDSVNAIADREDPIVKVAPRDTDARPP